MSSPECARLLPPRGDRSFFLALFFVVITPLLLGGLAVALGQDANWDLRNYHWYNAYAFLNQRYGLDILPSQIPYFYNPLLDVPFFIVASHVSARMATFILGAVQGINFSLLFFISYACLSLQSTRARTLLSAVLAALGILGGGGLALLGTTFGDNLTSLGVLLSVLLVVSCKERIVRGTWIKSGATVLALGIIPGLMMGLKLPNVIFCVGLCFAFLGLHGTILRRFHFSLWFGIGILCGVAITFGSWGWYLEKNFGNPIFPYFNNFFKSPMLGNTNLQDVKFLPRSMIEYIFFPWVFAQDPFHVGEIPWRDWRLPIVYFLLPCSLLIKFGWRKCANETLFDQTSMRYVLWVACLSYIAWLLLFSIYRYAVPLEMLSPLLIAGAVGMWPLSNKRRLILVALILTVVALSIEPGNWTRRTSWTDHFVETDVPTLGNTSDLMVLMAGTEPYSHLIPQFPKNISFVRIQSNFSSPEQKNGTNQLIREKIASHKGHIMMLIPVWNKNDARDAMAAYNIGFDSGPCQKVRDKLYDANDIELCPVKHL